MQLKNIQNKYLFILALMFLCQGVIVFTNWLIYYPYAFEEKIRLSYIIKYFLLTMFPALTLVNIYLVSSLIKKNFFKIIVSIIVTFIAFFLYVCFSVWQISAAPKFKAPMYIAYSLEDYKIKVTRPHPDKFTGARNFPDEIPQNAKNYCCFTYAGLNYLRFNIDTKYLNDIIAKNKDKIEKKMNMKTFEKDYQDVYSIFKPYFSIKDSDKYQIYLFDKSIYKNPNYYDGIITLRETGEIIFFNFDKKYHQAALRRAKRVL